jgi:hypothetical protein
VLRVERRWVGLRVNHLSADRKRIDSPCPSLLTNSRNPAALARPSSARARRPACERIDALA